MSQDKPESAYSGPAAEVESDASRFRRTLIKVLAVQVVSLVLLYSLQFFRP
jgi:hypothetical protein